MISHSLACLNKQMQRLREQFSRRKQQSTTEQPISEPVTPAKSTSPSTAAGYNYGQPISDPHPTSSHHHSNLFRFPSNSSQQQKSPSKKASSAQAQKARKQMLRQQAHSLPQSPPVKKSSKHPPLAYHESQPSETSTIHHSKEYFNKDFRDKESSMRQTDMPPSFSTKQSPIRDHLPQMQSLQQQIHYKRNLMSNQMQLRYQQMPRHQRVNQSFSSSQHMMPSSPLLQTESKYRSCSFEEIRSVKENKMIYEEHSIEVDENNLSLSESNSSSLHNLQHQQIGLPNTIASCSSSGSINVNTSTVVAHLQNIQNIPHQQNPTRPSNIIRNPTVFTLASTKSPRSKSFDCCQAAIQHTLQPQQSLQDKLLTTSSNNTVSSKSGLISSNINNTNISPSSSTLMNMKEQQQQQQSTGSTSAVRCSTPQPISNIQAISTASISSIASDSPSKKRGPFLEIPKWKMLIRRTTTSNQLSAQHKNVDGIGLTTLQYSGTEFSPPNSAAIEKQTNFERECVHCALIGELLKLNRISSRGTSTHTSLSSLEDSDSEHLAVHNKPKADNGLSKSGDYFDLSTSIKELDTLSEHINKLELETNAQFSSQFAKCSSGSSDKSGSSGKEVGKESCSNLKSQGANDSLEEDFYTDYNQLQQQSTDETNQTSQTATNQNETNVANIGDLSKSVSFNDGSYCENCAAEHTSTSNSRNASLISLPMVTLSLPSSESDDQITSLASVGGLQQVNYTQQASNQFHSPPISPPPFQQVKNELSELEQEHNNSSCITVVSLEVPVLANKSGRSASVDSSAYLKVPQRTDIGSREAPPARGGQRSKSVDIALPIGPEGPYLG